MPDRMEPVVELRSVVKRFGGFTAVNGVSLALAPGQFYSLLGPSGCGKTTTLRLIAGFEQPDEGEVHLHGEPVNHVPPYQRNVSTVFQNYALFPHLTVAGNVEFGLRQARTPAEEMHRRVNKILELVQLTGYDRRMPQQLSGGERQRVALARSMVLRPDVLLLDEPLAALDETLRQEMRLELKRLQRAAGITFLFVTHDQEEAITLSDRVAVMNRGKLEQVGTPEEIYQRPRTRFVAGFLGNSNVLDVRVSGVHGALVELATPGGRRWLAPCPDPAPSLGEAVSLVLRPEVLRISTGSVPEGAQAAVGRISHSVFLGAHRRLGVEIEPGLDLTALTPPECAPPETVPVSVFWELKDSQVLTS
jgi:spermidine/putrescine transport system ATP-binding protein